MKNPLNKRFPRELRSEFWKYTVLFVFLAGMIALVSGFLVASESMMIAYDEGFEKYQIEDGNFELETEADAETIAGIEEEGLRVYPNFYIEEETEGIEVGDDLGVGSGTRKMTGKRKQWQRISWKN